MPLSDFRLLRKVLNISGNIRKGMKSERQRRYRKIFLASRLKLLWFYKKVSLLERTIKHGEMKLWKPAISKLWR